ncbi:MAG: DUF1838 family protein [Gammaproteobacteria bacterium]|nr:DUF1838 family protein [Gammaproteobacteria bacterium]
MSTSYFVRDLVTGRRSALGMLGGMLAGAAGIATPSSSVQAADAATPADAASQTLRRKGASKPLDFNDPIDNLYAFGKIWMGYETPVIGGFHGLMYLRMPGKRLVPVFGFTGTGVMQAEHDPKGFLKVKSRETGYFTDLRSGDILEYWDNPLTGERCEVYHFYNSLITGTLGVEVPKFAPGHEGDAPTTMNEGTVFPDADGKYPFRLPFSRYGDDLMLEWDYAHEYTNPVTPEGWPTYSTGPKITPSEHFTMFASLREVEDRDLPTARMRSGFARLSECWPWMRMGKHAQRGLTLFGRLHSHKGLGGTRDVPPKVLAYIEKHAPEYLTLPPGWPAPQNSRLETWGAFAQDVPPETPGYEWQAKSRRPTGFKGPPTGLGRKGYV